jgi:oxygen-independent coproporphyrinogen-3 oxidase
MALAQSAVPGSSSATQETLGVYVSVPFCRAKCSFCNFASGVGSGAAIDRYIARLCDEMRHLSAWTALQQAFLPRGADTVYLGGGTPSLLSAVQLRAIFAGLREQFAMTADAEITLEAAPGQIADELLQEALRCGVSRVSLGVQSFVDKEAAAVGRAHTGDSCVREIARLRSAGIAEVGIDLIAGLPHQTAASWQYSLERAVDSGVTHLSVYMLEVDEDSRLGLEVLAGGTRYHAHATPDADLSAEMYDVACEWLTEHGFAQYEISNFARVDHGRSHVSRHNRKYWERAPYVGLGLDAHSMLQLEGRRAIRWANVSELLAYERKRSEREVTLIDADAAFEETLFLGLRMNEGICVADLRAGFGQQRVAVAEQAVHEMAVGGVMLAQQGRWRLTARGRAVSNEVFERLLVEAVA